MAAALEALSQLTFENDQIIKEIFLHWKLEKFILILLKFLSHPYSKIKFYSAVCLTNLWRRKILIDFIHQIKINLIPTLISLFNDSNSFFSSEAPFILGLFFLLLFYLFLFIFIYFIILFYLFFYYFNNLFLFYFIYYLNFLVLFILIITVIWIS